MAFILCCVRIIDYLGGKRESAILGGSLIVVALLGVNLFFVSKGWPIVSFFAFTLSYMAIVATLVKADYDNRDKIDQHKPPADSCIVPEDDTMYT